MGRGIMNECVEVSVVVPIYDEKATLSKSVQRFLEPRNFGHRMAIVAGSGSARGKAVIVMDDDLQGPLDTIPEVIEGRAKRFAYATSYRLSKHASELGAPSRLATSLLWTAGWSTWASPSPSATGSSWVLPPWH